MEGITGPHSEAEILFTGEPFGSARAAMLMVHGRGATAESILELSAELNVPGFAYVAPQAEGNTWYPYPFMTPMELNEPWLSSALSVLEACVGWIESQGIPPEKIVILGFSQGACLATEFAARNARRYMGIAGLSGGLIGPDTTPRDYAGSLVGTPVFLGCSDIDPHIPKERVLETEQVFRTLGGVVTARLYPNMGHFVNEDEINEVRNMMG